MFCSSFVFRSRICSTQLSCKQANMRWTKYCQTCLLLWFGHILYAWIFSIPYENMKKKKIHICSSLVFQSRCTWLSLTTSRCRSVGFSIVLCVVSALNFQAIQSEACIAAAKYEHLAFFSGSHVEISFRLVSLRIKWNGKEVKILFLNC